MDYGNALCAVLRAKGIPAKFTRTVNHSKVHLFIDRQWYEADVLRLVGYKDGKTIDSTEEKALQPVTEEKRYLNGIAKANGGYAEGLDSHDIGIRSLKDFNRFG